MGINRGRGIGFFQKTLVFVPGAPQGEDIFCQITSARKFCGSQTLICE